MELEKYSKPNSPLVQYAHAFVNELRNMSNAYRTSEVLLPMGDDFSFYKADSNYKMIDMIIENVKKIDPSINIFYSTLT